MSEVLRATDISMKFSGIVALSHVNLSIHEGERVGLIGPNGAGKTTLFNCILGLLRPESGHVMIDGHDASNLAVHKRAALGIGRTFQRIELFPDSTVREHLLIAERTRRGDGRLWRDLLGMGRPTADEIDHCDQVLELLGLAGVATEPIERLSLGQGRLVEVGRALMTQPKVLLLDEPSSGLARQETAALAQTLREVQREQGFAILLVEHDVEFVSTFTERAYVLDFGQMIMEGPIRDVMRSDAVRSAYLGTLEVGR